ncbi:MAG: DEAD/DEAH box helicase [Verrucomicrobiia bacterium]
MSFRVFNLGPSIDRAIQEAEYVEPTPIQAAAIPKILAGHDVIGIAQTGTGKTAAFVLPVLAQLVSKPPKGVAKTTRALILAPTRELAVQIEESVRLYSQYLSLKAVAVYGGVGEQPQIRGLRNRVDLVIATPGRLLDLMEQGHANFSGLEF